MVDAFETPGMYLRRLVEARSLSQSRLSETLGVDRPRLSKWLSSKELPPGEYLPVIIHQIGAGDQDLQQVQDLMNIELWRRRLRTLASAREFYRLGVDGEALTTYLLSLAGSFCDLDVAADPGRSPARLYAEHLFAACEVLQTAKDAVSSSDVMVFRPDNIRFHLRYPANYYFGALLGLQESNVLGGDALAQSLQQCVDDVADEDRPASFLENLAVQHAHHINARYGQGRNAGEHADRLPKSPDVHDRRMYLIGQALRPGASEAAWSALFDNLRDPNFQAAVVAFDSSHYDRNEIQQDGWLPYPGQIRRTALRYLAGLTSPDGHLAQFSAVRLMILIQHVAPAVVKRAGLRGTVLRLKDHRLTDIPNVGLEAMSIIENNSEKD